MAATTSQNSTRCVMAEDPRHWLATMAVVAWFLAAPHLACAQTGARAADASEVADVGSLWSTLDVRWNARDATGFSKLFTVDASLGFVGAGAPLEGREKIHRHFSEQFSRQSPDLRHRTAVRDFRSLAPGVHAIDGEVEVVRAGADGSAPGPVLA